MTIDQLRLAFLDETAIYDGGLAPGMTTHTPPVTYQVNKIEKPDGRVYWEVKEKESEPADQIGENLSRIMVQLIGSLTEELSFYSPDHPVRRAWAEFDRTCRRRHRGLYWVDHAGDTPLCGQMLWNVLADGASILWCSNHYGISYPRAERLIGSGAAFVAERLSRWDDERQGIAHDRSACAVCREEAG